MLKEYIKITPFTNPEDNIRKKKYKNAEIKNTKTKNIKIVKNAEENTLNTIDKISGSAVNCTP